MTVRIEAADPGDTEAMLLLFPRLAAFDVPDNRNPEHLWGEDAKMLQAWANDGDENCIVLVAKEEDGTVLGISMVTVGPELLSHAPSSHLEVIAVAAAAEGRGIGKALLEAAEKAVIDRGAKSMSLHVFRKNIRARRIYERAGFDEELIRCIKLFSKDALR